MDSALISLALTAGAVAALNPCGFALLPAYLGLLLREPETVPAGGPDGAGGVAAPPAGGLRTAGRSVRRALSLTAIMTAGFVVVFAVFGLVVAPIAASVQQYLPWVTLATGVALVVLGGFLLTGKQLRLPGLQIRGRALDGSVLSTFLYGVTYALASLTCTVAPFLAIVVTSLRSSDALNGLVLFFAYAVGMGLVVGVAAVAVALARTGMVGSLRGATRWIPVASGALVLLVGAYVAYYGIWEIRVLDGADPADPIIDAALSFQATVAGFVRDLFSFG